MFIMSMAWLKLDMSYWSFVSKLYYALLPCVKLALLTVGLGAESYPSRKTENN
jgi:hypothetical protein